MKLQAIIDESELNMTEQDVKSFFLGILCAVKPMPFTKAFDELMMEALEDKKKLEAPMKELWNILSTNLKKELGNMLHGDIENLGRQLDYFLSAMSLSGTNADTCKDEELVEFIEEIESIVEDMEDEPNAETAGEVREYLFEVWEEFVSTKN